MIRREVHERDADAIFLYIAGADWAQVSASMTNAKAPCVSDLTRY